MTGRWIYRADVGNADLMIARFGSDLRRAGRLSIGERGSGAFGEPLQVRPGQAKHQPSQTSGLNAKHWCVARLLRWLQEQLGVIYRDAFAIGARLLSDPQKDYHGLWFKVTASSKLPIDKIEHQSAAFSGANLVKHKGHETTVPRWSWRVKR